MAIGSCAERHVAHARYSHPRGRPNVLRRVIIGAAAASLALCASCANDPHINDKLEKVARGVPVPPDVTFASVAHTQMSAGLATTYEVDVRYTNHSMNCDALRAAWIAILAREHVQTYDVNQEQIFIENHSYVVNVDLGDIGNGRCPNPSVGVQSKP